MESDVSDAVEEGADSDSEDSVGVPELRPMHVTSHKEVRDYLPSRPVLITLAMYTMKPCMVGCSQTILNVPQATNTRPPH